MATRVSDRFGSLRTIKSFLPMLKRLRSRSLTRSSRAEFFEGGFTREGHSDSAAIGKFPTFRKRFPISTQKESLSGILGSRNKMCRESGLRLVAPKWHGSRTPMGMS